MNTTKLQAGAAAANRRIGLNRVTAKNAKWHYGIPLVCAFLVALGGSSAQAAAEATYKLFGREVGGYASKDDLPAIVNKELGPRATLADWNEIKTRYGGSEAGLKAFCEKVGLAPNGSAWVTQGGKRFWQNERHYFVYRADHKTPEDFMLHDQMQNNFLLLGSWFNPRPILVKITGYNATDAAKWAKRDAMLKAANSKDISGAYTLVAVNGNKVPATVSHEGRTLQVRSGTFTIKADGTCTSKVTFVPPSGTEATVETTATYSREGPKLDMQWQGAGITTGTLEGNSFTMENEGMVFAYRKGGAGKEAQHGADAKSLTEGAGGGGSPVSVSPAAPAAGRTVTIRYVAAGRNLASASPVCIHLGWNNWSAVVSPDRPMAFNSVSNWWQYTTSVPRYATNLNCAFNNGSGTWDNNGEANWNYPVRAH